MSLRLSEADADAALARLRRHYRVYAPVAEYRGGRFSDTDNIVYQEVSRWRDIVWQEKSHMAPSTVISPITETLFHFDHDVIQIAEVDRRPRLIFARACDINAMSRLDYMYLKNGNNADYSYALIRDSIKFVLMECASSFENCFCVSMGTNRTDNYSAALRFDEQGVNVEITDPALQEAFADLGQTCDYHAGFVSENPEKVVTPDQICDDPKRVRQILQDSPLWNDYQHRCIGCGRCTTGCPTCTCYSIFDVAYAENPQRGERRRQWASCMVEGFTDMAGGHHFRNKVSERLRFRALHKVNDYRARAKEGEHMCVGCGRCDDRCPQYIKFSNIINKMSAEVARVLQEEQK
ncbi:anaerobic sulfite reductase subunit AsrA [Edwardsiella tarda]|uniref:anaerobic sulfite reductase subunit AsrA n=1 Tax=Edwardsiella tarda TaxID=636 RepID=UPI001967FEF8|nr:anaerobic sulfite reductase subunit AsrA [Edwardsiella tarda]